MDDTLEQQEHARRGITGFGKHRVGRELLDGRDLAPKLKLLLVEVIEQVDPAQILERRPHHVCHAVAR
jgi:hypothetical protein